MFFLYTFSIADTAFTIWWPISYVELLHICHTNSLQEQVGASAWKSGSFLTASFTHLLTSCMQYYADLYIEIQHRHTMCLFEDFPQPVHEHKKETRETNIALPCSSPEQSSWKLKACTYQLTPWLTYFHKLLTIVYKLSSMSWCGDG